MEGRDVVVVLAGQHVAVEFDGGEGGSKGWVGGGVGEKAGAAWWGDLAADAGSVEETAQGFVQRQDGNIRP